MKPKNQLTREECLMKYPKSSWFKTYGTVAECPEDNLQEYANEAILLRKWQYIRFETALMGWIKSNAPGWVQGMFFRQVAGKMPDNIIMVPITDGMYLSVKLELKTQDKNGLPVGKLHGKQKYYASGWYIARSPEQINSILDKIELTVKNIKNILKLN